MISPSFKLSLFFLFICCHGITQVFEVPWQSEFRSILFKAHGVEIKWTEHSNQNIQMLGSDKNKWNFKKDESGRLIIEQKDFDLVKEKKAPRALLSIKSPFVPVELLGDDVLVNFENFRSGINVNITKGAVKSFKTAGDIFIQLLDGEIVLDNQNGPWSIMGTQVKLQVKNSVGDGRIKILNGVVLLDKDSGQVTYKMYQGTGSIQQHVGGLTAEQIKGSIQIQQSIGRFEVTSEDAVVDVKGHKEMDLNLTTKSGKAVYSLSGVTGAWLNLSTHEGDLYLPNPLRPQKLKTESFFKGRSPGDKTGARVEIRSQQGNIVVR